MAAQPPLTGNVELARLRPEYLRRQLEALRARVRMLSGTKMSFDEESQALYDAVAPTHPDRTSRRCSTTSAGGCPVKVRSSTASKPSASSSPSRATVSGGSSISRSPSADGGRCRTLELPATESFTVEYVTGKSWSGYNWYHGTYRSVIQVNTDLPIFIDRAIDLACHEGYPGHHVYNALLEKNLTRDRGWPEFSIYALFSPQSLIAEGTANYGIEVAFPGRRAARLRAGRALPGGGPESGAGRTSTTRSRPDRPASYAGNEAARRY